MSVGSRPSDCVIDASVGVKLFLTESLSDKAAFLFAQLSLSPPPVFHVPDLFYLECTNVLWKSIKRLGFPIENALLAITRLRALPLQVTSTIDLIEDALALTATHNITAYDASYIALSQQLGLAVVTADEKLVLALSGMAYRVQWLGNL